MISSLRIRLPLVCLLLGLAPVVAHAVPVAYKVADPISLTSGSNHYQSIDFELRLDPSKVNWISWSQSSSLQSYQGRPVIDGAFENNFGTDDYFKFNLTSKNGIASSTYTLDKNNSMAVSYGQQAILYGDQSVAPDVVRQDFAGNVKVFDESGVIGDSIFANEDCYTFHFDFFNKYNIYRGHNEFWLLIDVVDGYIPGQCDPDPPMVPEPATLALVALGITTLAGARRRFKTPKI